MIIKHVDGQISNTDKFSDIPSEIIEASENFRNLCYKYRRQFFLVCDPHGDARRSYICYNSLSSQDLSNEQLKKMGNNIKEMKENMSENEIELIGNETQKLCFLIDMGIFNFSQGNLCLKNVKEE